MKSDENKFIHKKSLGQHFLNSSVVPGWMCEAGVVTKEDLVLEVGPGTGVLSRAILERGANLIALEADERAITVLKETFPEEIKSGQLTLLHLDVRKLNLNEIPELSAGNYKVISNIPYYLSGQLFRIFLETNLQPSSLVFLVQKEVAERIARDKKESLLSLAVKAFGDPTYHKTVRRGHFTPPPRVDSAIISIENITRDRVPPSVAEHFFTILHLGFGQKRKQLLGNLASTYDRQRLINIFSTLNIKEDARAEDVSLNMWLELTSILSPKAVPTKS